MNTKNTLYLFEKYPKIFPVEDRQDLNRSLMGFGFECSDGWLSIIDTLCEKIQTHIDTHNLEQVVASQVKEKYGELCFYVFGATDEVWKMIEEAEKQSSKTCETCGTTEKVFQTSGWVYTTCYKCHEKRLGQQGWSDEDQARLLKSFEKYK